MAWYKHATTFPVTTNGGTPTITQLDTAWATWEADANVHWQRAASSLTAPAYLVLKRKDGSAGRIIFTCGTAPASNYVGYSETGVAANLYMGYDPLATTDTPLNYSVNGGALFGSPGDLGRLRSPGQYLGSYNMRLYCNAAEDIVVLHCPGGSQNTFAWGKMIRTDGGVSSYQCYHVGNQASPPSSGGYRLTVPLTSSYSTTSNLSSQSILWVRDTAANEGTGAAWTLLLDVNSGGSFVFSQGNFAMLRDLFSRPNGVHRFAPHYFVPCIQNAFARPSFSTCTTRHMGHGAPLVVDGVWTDNASAVRGYYLGYTATPSTDINGFSLLNETF